MGHVGKRSTSTSLAAVAVFASSPESVSKAVATNLLASDRLEIPVAWGAGGLASVELHCNQSAHCFRFQKRRSGFREDLHAPPASVKHAFHQANSRVFRVVSDNHACDHSPFITHAQGAVSCGQGNERVTSDRLLYPVVCFPASCE